MPLQNGHPQLWETYSRDMKLLKIPAKSENRLDHRKPESKRFGKEMYQYLHEFSKASTIHGFRQLAIRGRHWTEYILWTIVMIAAVGMTIYISKRSWARFQEYPTVIVMEKSNWNWNITFPTAILCPEKKVDPELLISLAAKYKVKNKSAFVEFFTSLSTSDFETYSFLPEYDEVPPDLFLDIIVQAAYNFSHEVTSTLTLSEEKLDPILTGIGICYSYNSKISPFFNPRSLIGVAPMAKELKDPHYCNALEGDEFASVVRYQVAFNISIGGPFDFPAVDSPFVENDAINFRELEVACLPLIATPEVYSLNVNQRKCRARRDGKLRVSDVYSYNLCRIDCRMDLAMKLCGCVPYLYVTQVASVYKEKLLICDVKGMKCLGRNGTLISDLRDPETKQRIPCPCFPLCTDYHFRITSNVINPWPEGRMKWMISDFPRTRYKRTIIYGFTDLIIGVGATAGLFLGCSVLSFVEVIYFFTLRLWIILYKKGRADTTNKEVKKMTNRIQRFRWDEMIN